MKNLFAVCALFALTLSLSAAEDLKWTTDYTAALAQAKSENRKVFLFFTGSDWCSWCKRLNKEILSQDGFKEYAAKNLILVELDYPRSKSQPREVKAQNAKLMDTYKIEGYPTVIVLDSAGKKVGELGYQEGGPGPFVEALGKM
jgi:thioredoxin-related protein